MKYRMYNVFLKKIKKEKIAIAASNVVYAILYMVYLFTRVFLNKKNSIEPEKAEKILNDYSPKPQMEYSCKNNEKKEVQLSIIVPAYNSEKTIVECVKSVIEQVTSVKYELIIINDGSTDNTKGLVEKIKDSHIRIIDQDNRGFSGARNRGIDECVGSFIMFLDSDDKMLDNSIESMMKSINDNEADIVQGGFCAFDNHHCNTTVFDNMSISKYKNKTLPGYPWGKIYRRDLFDNVRFPLNVWFEDTIVCILLYRLSRKIVTIKDVVYAWRLNPEGITRNARKKKKCVDHYWVMEHTIKKAGELGLPNDDIQYELVKGHLSSLMYRRLSLQGEEVLKSAFALACRLLDGIRPKDYVVKGRMIEKDIEKAFRTGNYKLWKWASFVV